MRAGDRDLAAALRDAQSLVTVRTFEVAMRFPILKAQHSIMQAARDRPPLLEEFLILGVARLNVAREHAEVAQDKQRENEHAHPVPLHHPFDHHENDREQQQRAHPEHSAEDFRVIKELSDELLYHDYHSDNYHGYWKADKDFSGLTALVPSPEPGPLESLLRKEQLRFAFRVAARLLNSGKLTAVQRRCFIAYFIKGKTVAEIAHDEKTYRMTIWRHIRRLEAALRDAV